MHLLDKLRILRYATFLEYTYTQFLQWLSAMDSLWGLLQFLGQIFCFGQYWSYCVYQSQLPSDKGNAMRKGR